MNLRPIVSSRSPSSLMLASKSPATRFASRAARGRGSGRSGGSGPTSCLRFGCRRHRRRAVPVAARRLDLDGLVGLRIGGEGLHGKARGDEGLRVEPSRDVVAFPGGILVALLGGERE